MPIEFSLFYKYMIREDCRRIVEANMPVNRVYKITAFEYNNIIVSLQNYKRLVSRSILRRNVDNINCVQVFIIVITRVTVCCNTISGYC